jgi:hypothetical protein
MFNKPFTTCVASSDGSVEFIPTGQSDATRFAIQRDPVAEQIERERRGDEELARLNPALHRVWHLFDAKKAALAQWQHVVDELGAQLGQAQATLAGTSPDSPLGTKEDRRYQLRQVQERYDEAVAECAAAREEFVAAQDEMIRVNQATMTP